MKRSIASAITLAVSLILLSLVSSDSTTQAQLRGKLFHWDTGVVALGPNQVLRIVGDWNGDGDTTVGFREIKYGQGGCNGPVCKLVILSSTTSGPHIVPAGEAIALQAGVQNSNLAAGPAELKGGGETGKAAADDDDVIHDRLRVHSVACAFLILCGIVIHEL